MIASQIKKMWRVFAIALYQREFFCKKILFCKKSAFSLESIRNLFSCNNGGIRCIFCCLKNGLIRDQYVLEIL